MMTAEKKSEQSDELLATLEEEAPSAAAISAEYRPHEADLAALDIQLHGDMASSSSSHDVTPVASSSSHAGPSQPLPSSLGHPQAEDAAIMERLGMPMGSDQAIPQIIHRFWTGGPMSEHAMSILRDTAEKTAGTAWQKILWRSKIIDSIYQSSLDSDAIDRIDAERRQLGEWGYEIRFIEELGDQAGVTFAELYTAAEMAGNSALNHRRFDDIKYFSDLARLLYLQAYGGHHMDIDIGLGGMDMAQQYSHNDPSGEIPLLGAVIRDKSDAEAVDLLRSVSTLQNAAEPDEASYSTAAAKMVERAKTWAAMSNALIATKPGTKTLQNAIDSVMKPLRSKPPELRSGMAANPALLGLTKVRTMSDFEAPASSSIPPYLLRLQHLTDESDNI